MPSCSQVGSTLPLVADHAQHPLLYSRRPRIRVELCLWAWICSWWGWWCELRSLKRWMISKERSSSELRCRFGAKVVSKVFRYSSTKAYQIYCGYQAKQRLSCLIWPTQQSTASIISSKRPQKLRTILSCTTSKSKSLSFSEGKAKIKRITTSIYSTTTSFTINWPRFTLPTSQGSLNYTRWRKWRITFRGRKERLMCSKFPSRSDWKIRPSIGKYWSWSISRLADKRWTTRVNLPLPKSEITSKLCTVWRESN